MTLGNLVHGLRTEGTGWSPTAVIPSEPLPSWGDSRFGGYFDAPRDDVDGGPPAGLHGHAADRGCPAAAVEDAAGSRPAGRRSGRRGPLRRPPGLPPTCRASRTRPAAIAAAPLAAGVAATAGAARPPGAPLRPAPPTHRFGTDHVRSGTQPGYQRPKRRRPKRQAQTTKLLRHCRSETPRWPRLTTSRGSCRRAGPHARAADAPRHSRAAGVADRL